MMLTLVIITAFIIWFSSIWIAVLSLMSFIGGWKKLSRIYPSASSYIKNNDVKYHMSSMKMGFVNYRLCINITFTGTGILIETLKIFSVMHRPIFIPYNKISDVQTGKVFSTYTAFTVEDKKITIYGKAGEELSSRLSSRGTSK